MDTLWYGTPAGSEVARFVGENLLVLLPKIVLGSHNDEVLDVLRRMRAALTTDLPGIPDHFRKQIARFCTEASLYIEDGDFDRAIQKIRSTLKLLGPEFARVAGHDATSNLVLTLDPGSAPPDAIAEILADLSILYRRMGGSGINFTPQAVHVLAPADQ